MSKSTPRPRTFRFALNITFSMVARSFGTPPKPFLWQPKQKVAQVPSFPDLLSCQTVRRMLGTILKLPVSTDVKVRMLQLNVPDQMTVVFSYHFLSRILTPYHILSHLILQVGTKTISCWQLLNQFPDPNFFITSYHAFSLLITPYPLGWKQNHFMLVTFKLVPRPQSFYHILSRFVTLSHIITLPLAGGKTIFIWQF